MPLAKDSPNRKCSECGNSLAGRDPQAKTCSPKCRSGRSRRLKRALKAGGEGYSLPAAQKALRERIEGEVADETKVVIREELRPLVRDAMSEDTIRGIQAMIDLVPEMVEAVRQDLSSIDPKIRQAAYTLLAKYTLGPTGMVLAEPERGAPAKLEVVFPGMERPREDAVLQNGSELTQNEAPEAPADELQVCERCGETKLLEDFVPESDRCLVCQAEFTARAQAVLGAS